MDTTTTAPARTGRLGEMLTLSEVSASLGIAHSTVARQVRLGRLRAQKVGTLWLVRRNEVERYRRDSLGRIGLASAGARNPRARSRRKPRNTD